MSESRAFRFVCEELERSTSLDRIESRGTVRIALKEAGLEAGSVSPHQMGVVLTELMSAALEKRGVEGAAGLCRAIADGLAALPADGAPDAPESVFARLGRTG